MTAFPLSSIDPEKPPNSPDITRFSHLARLHLTLVGGRLQLLRRAARRGTVDLDQCVGRLDDIEVSVRRLTLLVAALEEEAEAGRAHRRNSAGDSPER